MHVFIVCLMLVYDKQANDGEADDEDSDIDADDEAHEADSEVDEDDEDDETDESDDESEDDDDDSESVLHRSCSEETITYCDDDMWLLQNADDDSMTETYEDTDDSMFGM